MHSDLNKLREDLRNWFPHCITSFCATNSGSLVYLYTKPRIPTLPADM